MAEPGITFVRIRGRIVPLRRRGRGRPHEEVGGKSSKKVGRVKKSTTRAANGGVIAGKTAKAKVAPKFFSKKTAIKGLKAARKYLKKNPKTVAAGVGLAVAGYALGDLDD